MEDVDLLATSFATENAFGGMYISYLEPELSIVKAQKEMLLSMDFQDILF